MARGRDHQGLTDQAEDVPTDLSEEQKAAARRIVAANAVDYKGSTRLSTRNLAQMVDDAEQLMLALGIHKSQDKEARYNLGPSAPITMPTREYAGPVGLR